MTIMMLFCYCYCGRAGGGLVSGDDHNDGDDDVIVLDQPFDFFLQIVLDFDQKEFDTGTEIQIGFDTNPSVPGLETTTLTV